MSRPRAIPGRDRQTGAARRGFLLGGAAAFLAGRSIPSLAASDDIPKSAETLAPLLPVRVENAGLVILAPFLARYFQKLDLMADMAFNSSAQQRRAVLLTQFMVTGKQEFAEHRLTLNKLICGVPLSAPLETGIDITDAEHEFARSLLIGVTKNWPGLERTTPQALQEVFLQRRGTIEESKDPKAFLLRVEPEPFDVLLDKLPWPIAALRLPWMAEPLFVRWR